MSNSKPMDKIIIINDSRIEDKLEKFLIANRNHIRFISDMDEVALCQNPVLMEIINRYEEKHKIRIESGNQQWFFRSAEIVRIEAKNDNIEIHLNNKRIIRINLKIDLLKKHLESFSFIRVHKDHIVNVNYLSKIYDMNAEVIELSNGTRLPVSKSYKSSVQHIFEEYFNHQ